MKKLVQFQKSLLKIVANHPIGGIYIVFSFIFTAVHVDLILSAWGTTTISLDNISVREVLSPPTISKGTVVRNSEATYVDNDGIIQTAPIDTARIENGALLTEPSATNLVTYSEDFSNVIWGKINSTVSINQTNSPDGTLTSDKLIENTSNSSHYLYQQFLLSEVPHLSNC